MPTRRTTLKTIAAGTVVGSLSGCVQLATRRTVEYNGTPAMVSDVATTPELDLLATAVGVEARRTIERFGITKEIVAHSWGLLYSFVPINNTGSSQQQMTMTFTTPSIKIAGRELNPIKDLTVDEIAKEFLSITQTSTGPNEEHRGLWGRTEWGDIKKKGSDATGKKVLRAFRDSVRSPSAEYQPPSLDASASGGTLSTVPDWDGDTYDELTWATSSGDAGTYTASIHFEKHDGDFVVLFSTAAESVKVRLRGDYGSSGEYASYVHPPDDEFKQEVLGRHLLETNLRGAQGLVEQSRNLIDETQNLLTEARNDTRDEEDDRFTVIPNTQDDLKRLDTVMGGLAEGLSSISTKTVTTDENGDWSANIERAQTATEIATRAHERVASHNDTRDEEDDRFVQIERNLDGLMRVSRTIQRTVVNGRKTVKARDV